MPTTIGTRPIPQPWWPATSGALVHALAVAAAIGTYVWGGHHQADFIEPDRVGTVVLAALLAGLLLCGASALLAPRRARRGYLLFVGIFLLDSLPAAWYGGEILGSDLDADQLDPVLALLIAAAVGGFAGALSAGSLARSSEGKIALAMFGGFGAVLLLAGYALRGMG